MDGAKAGQFFPSWADLGDLDLLVSELFFEKFVYFEGCFAPEVIGRVELRFPFDNSEVNGGFGSAMNHNPIKASKLELGGPEATRLAVGDPVGGGGFADGRAAALPTDRGAPWRRWS